MAGLLSAAARLPDRVFRNFFNEFFITKVNDDIY